MAALPTPPLVSVKEYLHTKYPNGDREYLDGLVVKRNVGTPAHSALQKILLFTWPPWRKTCTLQSGRNAVRVSKKHAIVCRRVGDGASVSPDRPSRARSATADCG